MRLLLHEHHFVLVVTQPGEVAVVSPVKELVAWVGALGGEQVALVVAVKMNLEGLAASVVPSRSLPLMSGVPAAATRVGTQSSAEKMSLTSVCGCMSPGQRIIAGTR
jgi:hypothetical protein